MVVMVIMRASGIVWSVESDNDDFYADLNDYSNIVGDWDQNETYSWYCYL